MKPLTRWAILALVVVVIGIALVFWIQRNRQQAAAEKAVAEQPVAPKPPEAPIPPKPEEPVTASVLFDFDRSVLRLGETPKLDELAAKIKGRTFDHLQAVGYADRIGKEAYNLQLSKLRAEAVQAYLVGKGVDAGRIRADGKGEAQPVTGEACKNMGPENRRNRKLIQCLQPDRRVEVELVVAR